jgi:hypothetical protein
MTPSKEIKSQILLKKKWTVINLIRSLLRLKVFLIYACIHNKYTYICKHMQITCNTLSI